MTAKTADVHSHAIPAPFIETVRREGARYGCSLETRPDGTELILLPDGWRQTMRHNLADIELRQQEMAAAGIDIMIESVLPQLLLYKAKDRRVAEWAASAINDSLLDHARSAPDRVIPMAQVPLQFADLAVKELERSVQQLGMPAVQIGSNVDGENLDEEAFYPFWEAAESLRVLVFVHPHDVIARQTRLKRYYLNNLIGNPLDTSIAVASIIFGGILDRYPKLKLCFAHAGGYAPWIRGRWRHGQQVRPEAKARGAERPFDEYFSQLYFDTVIHDQQALSYMIDSVGSDRVLFGTDYPADMGNWEHIPMIRSLPGLSEQQKEAILGGNALRLIGRAP